MFDWNRGCDMVWFMTGAGENGDAAAVEGAMCPIPGLAPPVSVPLTVLPPHGCDYLPGRTARLRAFMTREMPGDLYRQFMDAGFRRSGQMIYQPVCVGCRECVPIRVPAKEFSPNKSQRRCWRGNGDVTVSVGKPELTPEKASLYQRYVTSRHGKPPAGEAEEASAELESFLYRSPVQTLEFTYRLGNGELAAVGICDVCEQALSTVYFYFEPAYLRRGLGTYGALVEIDYCVRNDIKYYYLGFWIQGCGAMAYKCNFRPFEKLNPQGFWKRGGESEG